MNFLQGKYTRVLTAALLLQAFAFYALASRPEYTPSMLPLIAFPAKVGTWIGVKDFPIEQETLDVLKADDTLDRLYVNADTRQAVYLFIAFFKTQRYGQSPHSPKNCLPGAGWEPVPGRSDRPTLQVSGEPEPIEINKWVTERGTEQSITLYWYQSHGRVVASEFAAKFWSMADSVRYHRSDTALVKLTIQVHDGDVDGAVKTGYDFLQAMFPALLRQLPA